MAFLILAVFLYSFFVAKLDENIVCNVYDQRTPLFGDASAIGLANFCVERFQTRGEKRLNAQKPLEIFFGWPTSIWCEH